MSDATLPNYGDVRRRLVEAREIHEEWSAYLTKPNGNGATPTSQGDCGGPEWHGEWVQVYRDALALLDAAYGGPR